jgi:glycosyltransferase involved in cell wall biosynthesis
VSEQPSPTRPLLTIAIPTYNRAGCLKELLSGLTDQLKNERRVELMISDNASPDETRAVVEEFIAGGTQMRYIRTPQNIGADANFLQCFEQARGKYVWLFSDDDLIVRGGVAKILSYCESADYDLISLSNYPLDEAQPPLSAGSHYDAMDISDAREYAKRVHVFFTFISGNIINKDTVLAAGPKPFSELIGSSLIQLSWTYTALNRFSRGLCIREKLIGVRLNNTGGYKLFEVFGSTLSMITQKWLQSEILGQIVINGAVQRFWPSMLFEYKKCAGSFTDQAKPQDVLTPLFRYNPRYWLFAYPVAVLPYHLSAGWLFITRVLNRLDRAAGYPALGWGVPDREAASRRNRIQARGSKQRDKTPTG